MKKVLSFLFFAAGWNCFLFIIFLGVSDAQGRMVPHGYPLTSWTTYVWLFAGMIIFALLAKIFANWAEKQKKGTPRPNKRRRGDIVVACMCGDNHEIPQLEKGSRQYGQNFICPKEKRVLWVDKYGRVTDPAASHVLNRAAYRNAVLIQ